MAPENLTTLAHFSVSAAMSFPKSAGEPVIAMPPRSAIRPDEIVKQLPSVALLDVVGDPPRFRFRLFGTQLVAAYGQDLTGKFVDEILPLKITQIDGSVVDFSVDEHPRRDTTVEKLAGLKVLHPEIEGFSITAAYGAITMPLFSAGESDRSWKLPLPGSTNRASVVEYMFFDSVAFRPTRVVLVKPRRWLQRKRRSSTDIMVTARS